MDIQRIAILFGLAVTSYLLVLAWNEDYGNRHTSVTETGEVIIPDTVQEADLPMIPTQPSGADDSIPEIDVREESARIPVASENPLDNRLVRVRTDVLEVTIDPHGGDIVRVALPAYPAEIDTPDIPFVLVNPGNHYSAQSGLIGPDGIDRSGDRPVFRVTRNTFTMTEGQEELTVELDLSMPDGTRVKKSFLFRRGDYLIDVSYQVTNLGSESKKMAFFAQVKRDSQRPVNSDENKMGLRPFVGGATRTEDELYRKLEFDDIADEPYKSKFSGGYMAMVQHYFVSAWVPAGDSENTYLARKLADRDIYLFGFTAPLTVIAPNETRTLGAGYYAGPKDQYRLEEIAEGLNLTVDYGFLWWLAQPLFSLLTFLHGVFGNWGIAIILLTVVVKTVLYPLSAASFRSMAKMRKLQPEMARLKERFGDDRQAFSQAMMDLYKKEGANPLGGCFPILLQMPVFLALYWTLMESVELRQAPLALWIQDLSAMDPYFVLPILMGASMFLTQMMQPEPPDPMQARIMKMMPIMFTFFFLWFPSGLVLYWLVNNILSVLQQFYVTRQIEKGT